MGAQPDTSTSAPEVRHGIRQILAPIFVAKLLATYLACAAASAPDLQRGRSAGPGMGPAAPGRGGGATARRAVPGRFRAVGIVAPLPSGVAAGPGSGCCGAAGPPCDRGLPTRAAAA